MSLIVGVDPGNTGAFGLWEHELKTLIDVRDMPTFQTTVNKRVRTRIDPTGLLMLFEEFRDMGAELTVLEGVGGRPKQSASKGFVFGAGVGMVYMASVAARIPVETADAALWKVVMQVQPDPQQIRERARKEFPGDHEHWWTGKRGAVRHDRCEAALIAKFGTRMLGRIRPESDWRLIYKNANVGI